ncbi:hypothetical protein AK830_g9389 [Neonectria ditissima]|uniref:BTB domain-containing protein n=1 Tax=Neonectria ditissima TaxID=78410 RepID=A0A0P7B9X9_9HYPO|nr:hypothetical protein AK830_g9389 [Neonectria ditissima]
MAKRAHDAISSDIPTDLEDMGFEEIAPDGDIIFLVGSEAIRVQVSSAIMKAASPVFRAMFGPNFKEGQALATSGGNPIEVSLPDEDPQSFAQICRIIHHQRGLREELPALEVLFRIYGIADKCDLIPTIQFCVEVWIDKHASDTKRMVHAQAHNGFNGVSLPRTSGNMIRRERQLDSQKGYKLSVPWLFCLLFLCHAFGVHDHFETVSRRIIQEQVGLFSTLIPGMEAMTSTSADIITLHKLAGALADKQADVLAGLHRCIYDSLPAWIDREPIFKSGNRNSHPGIYLRELRSYDTNGFLFTTAVSIHERLSCIRGFQAGLQPPSLGHLLSKELNRQIDDFERNIEGLCLRCFKLGLNTCTCKQDY